MKIRAQFDKRQVDQIRKLLERDMQEAVMGLATLQVANIKKRVSRGEDRDDRRMPPYTRAYEKWKSKRGRDTTRRNLVFRGHMFQSMVALPDGRARAVIRFVDPLQRLKAQRNQTIAPFMGTSSKDFEKLSRWMDAFLAKRG